MSLWKLVIKEAWQRRWRLLVSILALVLSIGLIVAVITLNISSRQAMHNYLKNLGANLVVIPAEIDLFAYYAADPELLGSVNMPESHFFKLLETKMKGIEGIDPRLTAPTEIKGTRVVLTGILPSQMLHPKSNRIGVENPWKILSALSPGSNGAVLGAMFNEILNPWLDATLKVADQEIKVLGLLPQQGTIDDLRIYVHLRTLQKWLHKPSSLSEIRILYTDTRVLEKVASEIEGILENTRVVSHRRMATKQIAIMDSIRKYALALLAIILVLGSISIGNEMFHNTHERRREIGILTAIGATSKTILAIFILKAIFLSLIGGFLGYGLGSLAAFVLGIKLMHLKVYPVLALFPLAVLISAGFSILSSMVPAWRASRLDPGQILQED